MRRFFLLLGILIAALTGRAQVGPPPLGMQFLASDGNVYGLNSSGLYSYSPSNQALTILNANPNISNLCLEANDGTLLALDNTGTKITKVTLPGQTTAFAEFPGGSTAACPALANDGNYYGSSSEGGQYNAGFLYQLTPSGEVTIFYNFTGGADGIGPTATPIQAGDGNLYWFRYPGTLLRYSPTAGLSSTTLRVQTMDATPIEGADGNFYGTTYPAPPSVIQVEPNGAATVIYTDTSGSAAPLGGLFQPSSQLIVLASNPYGIPECSESGNYFTTQAIGIETGNWPSFNVSGSEDGADEVGVESFFMGGNGAYFGSIAEYDWIPDGSGDCIPSSLQRGIYLPTNVAPVEMALDTTYIRPGNSAKLTWQVNNAFSDTLQQCFAFGGLTGKVATSGSATITAPAAGTFVTSIVCGGTETGLATLTAPASTTVVASDYRNNDGSVTFTAVLTNTGNDPPTGNIEFFYGSVLIGSAPLINAEATFTASTVGIAPGTYNIVATYPGDANYAPGNASPIPVMIVAKAQTVITLTPMSQTLTVGSTASLTATLTVTNSNSPPTGTIKFLYGSSVLATSPLTFNYGAALTEATAGLQPGTYLVKATYSGDNLNTAATSAPATVILQSSPDTVTLSASPNPVLSGSNFTLTAIVTGTGTPTGTVLFQSDSTVIGSTTLNGGGIGSITLPAGTLAPGTYQLTAYYAGDKNNPATTSPAIILTVN
jgi:hypothetical protein